MLFSRLNNQTYQSVTDGRTDRIPISTSVSETIRKPPLVKAQTALKTKKNMAKNDSPYGGWNYYTLQCRMIMTGEKK